MATRFLFPRDLFEEMDRLQQEVEQLFDFVPTIRGFSRGAFPAINAGKTAKSVEIYAFAPGLDPASIEVEIEKGMLTIGGERRSDLPDEEDEKTTVHVDERFSGRFRRVIRLPEDVDAASVSAKYRDGVLHVSVARHAEALPRRVAIES